MTEFEKVSLKHVIEYLIHRKEKKSTIDITNPYKQKSKELDHLIATNLMTNNKVILARFHPLRHQFLQKVRFILKRIFYINNREKRDEKIERSKLKRDFR